MILRSKERVNSRIALYLSNHISLTFFLWRFFTSISIITGYRVFQHLHLDFETGGVTVRMKVTVKLVTKGMNEHSSAKLDIVVII